MVRSASKVISPDIFVMGVVDGGGGGGPHIDCGDAPYIGCDGPHIGVGPRIWWWSTIGGGPHICCGGPHICCGGPHIGGGGPLQDFAWRETKSSPLQKKTAGLAQFSHNSEMQ